MSHQIGNVLHSGGICRAGIESAAMFGDVACNSRVKSSWGWCACLLSGRRGPRPPDVTVIIIQILYIRILYYVQGKMYLGW